MNLLFTYSFFWFFLPQRHNIEREKFDIEVIINDDANRKTIYDLGGAQKLKKKLAQVVCPFSKEIE